MPWEARGRRTYYYRTRRVNGKVVRTYFGAGEEAHRAAEEDARKQARRKLVRRWKRDVIECDRLVCRRLLFLDAVEQVLLEYQADEQRRLEREQAEAAAAAAAPPRLSPTARRRLRARLASELRVPDHLPARGLAVCRSAALLSARPGSKRQQRARLERHHVSNEWGWYTSDRVPRWRFGLDSGFANRGLLLSQRMPHRASARWPPCRCLARQEPRPPAALEYLTQARARGPPSRILHGDPRRPPAALRAQATVAVCAALGNRRGDVPSRRLDIRRAPPKGLCCA